MAQLNFPDNPIDGQLYPSPCPTGVTQYRWDAGTGIWRIVGVATGVTPGVYGDSITVPEVTINVQGIVSNARNVPIRQASTFSTGVVQLEDSTDSLDTFKALTARAGRSLQEQIGNLANCIVPAHTNVVEALNDLQQQSTNLQTNALIWCGYYNAEEGDISYVSISGQRLGYQIGQELPTPGPSNGGDFFIVNVAGNPYIAGDYNAPNVFCNIGNWIVSESARWSEVNTTGVIKASDVQFTPSLPLTAINVQGAIGQIVNLFRTGIGGSTVFREAPLDPYNGQLWWNNEEQIFYVYQSGTGGGWQPVGGEGRGGVFEVSVGTGLATIGGKPITDTGTIVLKPALVSLDPVNDEIGGVIPRNGFNYSNGDGVLNLKIASAGALGGIKVGENLSITSDGTLNASIAPVPPTPISIVILDNLAPQFDGNTTTFNLTYNNGTPLPPAIATANLFINLGGINQNPESAFTVFNSTITFAFPPPAGAKFNGRAIADEFAAVSVIPSVGDQFNGTTKTFLLSDSAGNPLPTTIEATNLFVTLGGVLQTPGEAYTYFNSQITFVDPPPAGAPFACRLVKTAAGLSDFGIDVLAINDISGQFNGTRTDFVLLDTSGSPLPDSTDASEVFVTVGGVNQAPNSSYFITGSDLKFTTAPPAGSKFSARLIIKQSGGGGKGITLIDFLPPLTGGTVTSVGTVGIVNATPTQDGAMTKAYAARVEGLPNNIVSEINVTGPLTGGTITGQGTIGLPASSASQDGYMSSGQASYLAQLQNLRVNSNGTGTRTVSTAQPFGGSDGDIWYVV